MGLKGENSVYTLVVQKTTIITIITIDYLTNVINAPVRLWLHEAKALCVTEYPIISR